MQGPAFRVRFVSWLLPRRNPLKTGLVPASLAPHLEGPVHLQVCHNPLKTGLVPARRQARASLDAEVFLRSQSPENGSRPCKYLTYGVARYLGISPSQSPENGSRPCKSAASGSIPRSPASCRNPLKTGLVPASGSITISFRAALTASQSPENGSRPCKGGGGFFFSSPLYHPLTPSFPPASIRLRIL